MQAIQSIGRKAAVAIIGTAVAATLAIGAFAAGHSGDDLAARKQGGATSALSGTTLGTGSTISQSKVGGTDGGSKPVRPITT
jgi:hypothetical protein